MTAQPSSWRSGAAHNDIGGDVHGNVVQVGHVEEVTASQVVLLPSPPADRWPRRVGVVPLVADCFPGHPYTVKTRRLLAEWRTRTTRR